MSLERGEGYRADLNGLRGLAVALVVAFHLQAKGAGGGFIGVDVFFVLSGYLMTRMVWRRLEDGSFRYVDYLIRRALRIWPALAALVLCLLVAGVLCLPPFDLQRIAAQGLYALAFVSNHHYLANSGYLTHAGDSLWLLHTWSLSVEWQFYLLYPLLLIAVARWAPHARRRRWMLTVLVAVAAMSLAWHLLLARDGADSGFFLLPARMWELLAGGLVGMLSSQRPAAAPRWRWWSSYLGLALVLGAALLLALERVRPVGAGAWLLLPVAGTAMVLWSDVDNRVLRARPLQKLGLWSYSIYLWHWPLIVAARMTELPQSHPVLSAVTIAVGSVALGALSYTLIEQPAMRRRSAFSSIVAAGCAMAFVGVFSAVAVATGGLPARKAGKGDFHAAFEASGKARYFPDACSNYKKPLQEMRPCLIDKGDQARVLVIGDSHAEHFYAWFMANSPRSVEFFTAAECPPVPHMRRTQPGYHCETYAREAWSKARSSQYDTVIVAARWATVGLAGAPYCHQTASACVPQTDVSAKQRVVLAELRSAIDATLIDRKTVVVVDASPESRLRVADRVAREQFWYGETRLAIPLSALQAQTAWIEPLFKGYESDAGFHRVSLRSRLCEGTWCRVYDDALQRPIYFDESHFDPLWIERQTDLFAAFVKPP